VLIAMMVFTSMLESALRVPLSQIVLPPSLAQTVQIRNVPHALLDLLITLVTLPLAQEL